MGRWLVCCCTNEQQNHILNEDSKYIKTESNLAVKGTSGITWERNVSRFVMEICGDLLAHCMHVSNLAFARKCVLFWRLFLPKWLWVCGKMKGEASCPVTAFSCALHGGSIEKRKFFALWFVAQAHSWGGAHSLRCVNNPHPGTRRDVCPALALTSEIGSRCKGTDRALFLEDFNAYLWSLFYSEIKKEVVISCTENVQAAVPGSPLCCWSSAPSNLTSKEKQKWKMKVLRKKKIG